MNANQEPWRGTKQQILIGLVFATLIVAVIETNSADENCSWGFMDNIVDYETRGGPDGVHRIQMGRGRCRTEVTLQGDIEYTPDNQGIARLGPGASVEVSQRMRRERRRLKVESSAEGQLEYAWHVNSLPKEFDAEGRAWLAEVLPRVYRSTGLDADRRVARFCAAGGFDGVAAEIEEIDRVDVRAIYVRELLEQCTEKGDLVRALELARREITSDYELAMILNSIELANVRSEPERAAWLAGLRSIDSDWELRRVTTSVLNDHDVDAEIIDGLLQATSTQSSELSRYHFLIEVARKLPRGQALPASYFQAMRSIESEHHQESILQVVFGRTGFTEEEAAELLATAQQISSDSELARLLREFVWAYPEDRQLPEAFFQAVTSIDLASARRQVLSTVVDHRDLDPELAVSLLDAATSLSSDHELSAFLVRFLEVYPIGEPVPQEIELLMDMLDRDFEREKLRKALETRTLRSASPPEEPVPEP